MRETAMLLPIPLDTLCTLLEPKDYKPHWKSWDLNNLPMLPERFTTKVTNDSGIKKQFSIIKTLFEKATRCY
jgi:DNA topoisomerase-3